MDGDAAAGPGGVGGGTSPSVVVRGKYIGRDSMHLLLNHGQSRIFSAPTSTQQHSAEEYERKVRSLRGWGATAGGGGDGGGVDAGPGTHLSSPFVGGKTNGLGPAAGGRDVPTLQEMLLAEVNLPSPAGGEGGNGASSGGKMPLSSFGGAGGGMGSASPRMPSHTGGAGFIGNGGGGGKNAKSWDGDISSFLPSATQLASRRRGSGDAVPTVGAPGSVAVAGTIRGLVSGSGSGSGNMSSSSRKLKLSGGSGLGGESGGGGGGGNARHRPHNNGRPSSMARSAPSSDVGSGEAGGLSSRPGLAGHRSASIASISSGAGTILLTGARSSSSSSSSPIERASSIGGGGDGGRSPPASSAAGQDSEERVNWDDLRMRAQMRRAETLNRRQYAQGRIGGRAAMGGTRGGARSASVDSLLSREGSRDEQAVFFSSVGIVENRGGRGGEGRWDDEGDEKLEDAISDMAEGHLQLNRSQPAITQQPRQLQRKGIMSSRTADRQPHGSKPRGLQPEVLGRNRDKPSAAAVAIATARKWGREDSGGGYGDSDGGDGETGDGVSSSPLSGHQRKSLAELRAQMGWEGAVASSRASKVTDASGMSIVSGVSYRSRGSTKTAPAKILASSQKGAGTGEGTVVSWETDADSPTSHPRAPVLSPSVDGHESVPSSVPSHRTIETEETHKADNLTMEARAANKMRDVGGAEEIGGSPEVGKSAGSVSVKTMPAHPRPQSILRNSSHRPRSSSAPRERPILASRMAYPDTPVNIEQHGDNFPSPYEIGSIGGSVVASSRGVGNGGRHQHGTLSVSHSSRNLLLSAVKKQFSDSSIDVVGKTPRRGSGSSIGGGKERYEGHHNRGIGHMKALFRRGKLQRRSSSGGGEMAEVVAALCEDGNDDTNKGEQPAHALKSKRFILGRFKSRRRSNSPGAKIRAKSLSGHSRVFLSEQRVATAEGNGVGGDDTNGYTRSASVGAVRFDFPESSKTKKSSKDIGGNALVGDVVGLDDHDPRYIFQRHDLDGDPDTKASPKKRVDAFNQLSGEDDTSILLEGIPDKYEMAVKATDVIGGDGGRSVKSVDFSTKSAITNASGFSDVDANFDDTDDDDGGNSSVDDDESARRVTFAADADMAGQARINGCEDLFQTEEGKKHASLLAAGQSSENVVSLSHYLLQNDNSKVNAERGTCSKGGKGIGRNSSVSTSSITSGGSSSYLGGSRNYPVVLVDDESSHGSSAIRQLLELSKKKHDSNRSVNTEGIVSISSETTIPCSNVTGASGQFSSTSNRGPSANTSDNRPPVSPPPAINEKEANVEDGLESNDEDDDVAFAVASMAMLGTDSGDENQTGGEPSSSLELSRTTEAVLLNSIPHTALEHRFASASAIASSDSSTQSSGELRQPNASGLRGSSSEAASAVQTNSLASGTHPSVVNAGSLPLTRGLLFRADRSVSEEDLSAKYNSATSIMLGPLHDSSGGRPSSLRMRDGMLLTVRHKRRCLPTSALPPNSTQMEIGDDDNAGASGNKQLQTEEEDAYGYMILEGPAPTDYKRREEDSEYRSNEEDNTESFWWAVRAPLALPDKGGASSSRGAVELGLFSVESLDDVRAVHNVVYLLLRDGRFSEAVEVLSDSLLPALVTQQTVGGAWSSVDLSTENGSGRARNGEDSGDVQTLVEMTLRNIGTIQLWAGCYDEAADSFGNVMDSVKAKDPTSSHSTFDEAVTLVLLGLAMFSLEKYNEANQVLLDSLAAMQRHRDREAKGKETLDFDASSGGMNSQHKFTAGKILNNIGCAFFELGYYKSACRALHRSLLVFMSDDLECGYPDLVFDTNADLPASFPSLTDIMNGLKTREMEITNVPVEFELDVAVTFANLAYLLMKRKKFSAAAVCLAEAASLQKKVFGHDHSIRLSTMESLAFVNIKMHRYDRALRVYEDMLQLEENKFATSNLYHLTIAKLLGNMSYVYLKMHKLRAALACLRGVLANQEASLPPEDKSIEQTRNFMADIEMQLRKEHGSEKDEQTGN